MRVIAGKCRRTNLKTPEGLQTRPTTDRIKETLFNMLSPFLQGCRFLDLFSGSGGIGIEAASRGASYCVLVEKEHNAAKCIQWNLEATRLTECCKFLKMDVLEAITYLERSETQPFDLIFMDPPYNQALEKKVLQKLKHSELISTHTLIIVEADQNTDFDYIEELGFYIKKEKNYKTNKHMFLSKETSEEFR